MPAAADPGPLARQLHQTADGLEQGRQAFRQFALAREDGREAPKLSLKQAREHVRRSVAAPLVHPRVVIDIASDELGAVGPFLAHDLGPVRIVVPTAYEGTSLAADDVLGAVEAEAPKVADRPQRPSFSRCAKGVGGILDDLQAATGGDL